jgi:hypothetical protein
MNAPATAAGAGLRQTPAVSDQDPRPTADGRRPTWLRGLKGLGALKWLRGLRSLRGLDVLPGKQARLR